MAAVAALLCEETKQTGGGAALLLIIGEGPRRAEMGLDGGNKSAGSDYRGGGGELVWEEEGRRLAKSAGPSHRQPPGQCRTVEIHCTLAQSTVHGRQSAVRAGPLQCVAPG